jgi:hypothetical protein
MRLPITIGTLLLTATTAASAFAVAPAPIPLRDEAVMPIETVQYRQQTTRQRRQARTYRGYSRSYATAPRAARNSNPWGQCVGGLSRGASSAFPSWDTCSGR